MSNRDFTAKSIGSPAPGQPCLIIAEAGVNHNGRTDLACQLIDAAADAGADAVFIQSLDATGKEVLTFGREWKRRTPVFIAPTQLPQITKKQFAAAGISHTIFANQGLRAAHAAIDRTFGVLAQSESAAAVSSEISTVSAVATLVGAEKVVELETKQAEITAALEAPETYSDKGKFHHLNRELSTIVDEITAATKEWEEAATKLAEMEKP